MLANWSDGAAQAVVAVALAAGLVTAVRHPRPRVEATAALAVCLVVLASGLLDVGGARAMLDLLGPVLAFLVAMVVIADIAGRAGLFEVAAARTLAWSGGRPRRVFTGFFVLAALATVSLSLDSTVVLLTPWAAAAGIAAGRPSPSAYACLRMANSGSLLLPVANLTNLIALHQLHLSFADFGRAMAPVWVAVLAVEYAGLRWLFRRELADAPETPAPAPQSRPRMPRVPAIVLTAMLVGFVAGSPWAVDPAWVAGCAALVLAGWGWRRGLTGPRQVAGAAHLPFAGLVLALGLAVAALTPGVLGQAVSGLLPQTTSYAALVAVAVVATGLSLLVTNLPATLLLVPLVAPLGTPAVLAALVGLNVGAGLTWSGSLATLLWRRSLQVRGAPARGWDFHRVSLALTPASILAATAAIALTT